MVPDDAEFHGKLDNCSEKVKIRHFTDENVKKIRNCLDFYCKAGVSFFKILYIGYEGLKT